MTSILKLWIKRLRIFFRIRFELQMENIALRHQIAVFQRSKRRPHFRPFDRLFWVFLSKHWSGWENALEIIQRDTVKRWRCQGIRLIYSWRPKRNLGGRPLLKKEIRDLIKIMARDNFLWGAPRIYGELLMLGYKDKVSQASVSRYLKRYFPGPRYLTWHVFIKNQLIGLEGFYPTGILDRSIRDLSGILIAWWKQSWLMFCSLLTTPVSSSRRKCAVQASSVTSLSNSIDRIDQFHETIICQRVLIIPIRGSPSDKIALMTFFLNSSLASLPRVEGLVGYALIHPNQNSPPVQKDSFFNCDD